MNETKHQQRYEIYPVPQHEKNLQGTLKLTDEVNIVLESGVDKASSDFLQRILDEKGLTYHIGAETVSNRTNILLGIKGSQAFVDQYVAKHVTYDATIFEQIDPYVLTIDPQMEEHGVIAILGQDTESVFYGLATLQMLVQQVKDNQIHAVTYEDFSDMKWRGFIEGFYGFPWTHEARMDLMHFGSRLKMNAYIFGPKDDPYHNREWRTPYPEKELEKIRALAAVGNETKTHFIWAIHPGFNMIQWEDYDQELSTLLTKLDQLYDAGVRQFGLFMDDISTAQALQDRHKHVRLITDVANWISQKGDVKSLVYTPPFYNQAWTGTDGQAYLEALSEVPKNVEIMWTGSGVVGTVNETDLAWPKQFTGREPFVWLNWSVNDYVDSRLMIGKGEVLKKGTRNLSGVVSNPMEQAQLSKVALFAVADFTWNVDDFHDEQSWLDSFDYIEPEAADALRTIAYHVSDPSPSSHGLVLGESENLKAGLGQFSEDFAQGKSNQAAGVTLIEEFDSVLTAITDFKEQSKNEEMKAEIEPWLHCLHHVLLADKHAVQSAIAMQNGNHLAAWEALAKAADAMEQSKQYTVKKLNAPDITVEAGAKRLVPFANQLIDQLDGDVYQAIAPNSITNTQCKQTDMQANIYTNAKACQGMRVTTTDHTVHLGELKGLTLKPNEYFGIALPNLERVKQIQLKATIDQLAVEVSQNGVEWQQMMPDEIAYPNTAYVRICPTVQQAITFDLHNLDVELNRFSEPAITHNYDKVYQGELDDLLDGRLNKNVRFIGTQDEGKYIQLDLGGLLDVNNVAVVIHDGENHYFRQGDLQVSPDGENWETLHTFSHPEDKNLNFPEHEVPYRYQRVQTDGVKARYVRLISTADHHVWFALNKIIVNEGSVLPGNEDLAIQADPAGATGYEVRNAKDGKLSTAYRPMEKGRGELLYRLVEETKLRQLMILQHPASISEANVAIRDTTGWHEVGTLSASKNTIDTADFEHVFEVRITWTDVAPQIHEIIAITS